MLRRRRRLRRRFLHRPLLRQRCLPLSLCLFSDHLTILRLETCFFHDNRQTFLPSRLLRDTFHLDLIASGATAATAPASPRTFGLATNLTRRCTAVAAVASLLLGPVTPLLPNFLRALPPSTLTADHYTQILRLYLILSGLQRWLRSNYLRPLTLANCAFRHMAYATGFGGLISPAIFPRRLLLPFLARTLRQRQERF